MFDLKLQSNQVLYNAFQIINTLPHECFHEHYLSNGGAAKFWKQLYFHLYLSSFCQTFVFFDQIQFRIVVKVDSELSSNSIQNYCQTTNLAPFIV